MCIALPNSARNRFAKLGKTIAIIAIVFAMIAMIIAIIAIVFAIIAIVFAMIAIVFAMIAIVFAMIANTTLERRIWAFNLRWSVGLRRKN